MAIIKMVLQVKRLSENATLPVKGSAGAAGYDLYATEGCVLLPGRRAVVPTGISIKLPEGTYGHIAPRSGLAVKHGLQVGAGVVDPDYTGELKVVLFNHDRNTYVIHPGYRVAQLVLEKYVSVEVEEVNELSETARGEGGFGSSGVTGVPAPEMAPAPVPVPPPVPVEPALEMAPAPVPEPVNIPDATNEVPPEVEEPQAPRRRRRRNGGSDVQI